MSFEEQHHHVALPKLYGAPAYARPPAAVAHETRPTDLDDLPLTVEQTEEERRLAETLQGRPYASFHGQQVETVGADVGEPVLPGRPFRLRAIAGRLLGGDS